MKLNSEAKIPKSVAPLLWSYNAKKFNTQSGKKQLVVNAINYGDLKDWRWLVKRYGKNEIRRLLQSIPASELRPRVRRLAAIIFSIKKFNDAPRGVR